MIIHNLSSSFLMLLFLYVENIDLFLYQILSSLLFSSSLVKCSYLYYLTH